MGIEPGQILAVALRGVDEDEEYEAARAVMQKIERRRESRRRVAEYQGKQLAAATAASRASREPAGIEAANALAARLAAPAPRASRPFARRGAVPGDDDPVQCPECAAVGASAIESFLIHHEDQGPVPEDFTEADLGPVPGDRVRHGRQRGAVISGGEKPAPAHHAAEQRARETAVPAPSPQPRLNPHRDDGHRSRGQADRRRMSRRRTVHPTYPPNSTPGAPDDAWSTAARPPARRVRHGGHACGDGD